MSCPCEFMHYSGMSFGMSDTCLNLGHVSCMFENMSRLSGLCWNESSFMRARTIRELRRGEGVCFWARSVHGLRKEKEPEKLRKKERKEGRKRRRSQNLHCCKVEGSRT